MGERAAQASGFARARDALAFGAGALAILAAVPIARALEAWVVAHAGAQAFLIGVLATLGVSATAAWRTFARLGLRAQLALALGVALYGSTAWSLRANGVEAVHVIEYGALGVLALRALAHGGRDAGLAPAAALLAASVGALDELVQWAAPGRVGDLRDIGVDAIAVSGGPLLLALGVRPAWARAWPSRASGRRLVATLALAWLLLGAACLNTSANVAWLARNVPGLGALASQETGMVDYGFLLTLPGDRAFPSRLSAAAWRATDRARARAAGLVLAENVRSAAAAPRAAQLYEKFLAHYAPVSDPFVHELRVHLFRRDRYVETAARHAEDPAWRARDLTVAVRENEFLERFAPETLAAGGLAWSDADRRARVALASDEPYRSRVAEAVVTRVRERSVWAAWLAGAAAIALAALRLRRAGDAR